MIMYYFIFLIPAFFTLSKISYANKSNKIFFKIFIIFLIIVVGFRMSGGDFNNYYYRFLTLTNHSFSLSEIIKLSDPGYQLISYVSKELGLGFYGITIFCATISMWGLYSLLKILPNFWLGVTVATSYLVIVVDMGYMRQGVALGFIMIAISNLLRKKFLLFLFFSILAVTFHKTAIIMIAFGIFLEGKSKVIKVIALILVLISVWSAFLSSEYNTLYKNYVEASMQSSGAYIRVFLNAIPAILLLKYKKEWQKHFNDYNFWKMISFASIASIFLVSFASTVIDRLTLYFIPLQIVVFSRLPILMRKKNIVIAVVFLYFLVLFIWLNFGNFSSWWIPYKNWLFYDIF